MTGLPKWSRVENLRVEKQLCFPTNERVSQWQASCRTKTKEPWPPWRKNIESSWQRNSLEFRFHFTSPIWRSIQFFHSLKPCLTGWRSSVLAWVRRVEDPRTRKWKDLSKKIVRTLCQKGDIGWFCLQLPLISDDPEFCWICGACLFVKTQFSWSNSLTVCRPA